MPRDGPAGLAAPEDRAADDGGPGDTRDPTRRPDDLLGRWRRHARYLTGPQTRTCRGPLPAQDRSRWGHARGLIVGHLLVKEAACGQVALPGADTGFGVWASAVRAPSGAEGRPGARSQHVAGGGRNTPASEVSATAVLSQGEEGKSSPSYEMESHGDIDDSGGL
jgi:hypothetical protein